MGYNANERLVNEALNVFKEALTSIGYTVKTKADL